MLWIRIRPFTEVAFEPLSHETLPNPDFAKSIRREALLRYLIHYDFYGYSGISEDVINRFRLSGFFHPTEDTVWKDPESSEVVTRLEGIEAMRWLGRHVLRVIHDTFSPEEYEILFNRAPGRWKYVYFAFLPKTNVLKAKAYGYLEFLLAEALLILTISSK
jgi:hypothetical protein